MNILKTIISLVSIISIIVVLQVILFYVQIQNRFLYYQNDQNKHYSIRSLTDTKDIQKSTPSRALYPRFNLDDIYPNWTKKASLIKSQVDTNRRYLTIGLVTAKRPKNTVYLYDTLSSLITNANSEDFREIYIVIMLSDLDQKWRTNITSAIINKYPQEVKNGTIKIIGSFDWMYPKLQNLTHHRKWHSQSKSTWIAKQNIDFVLLWLYVYKTRLSKFYLHLEDDVIAVEGYTKAMKNFINQQKGEWTCLEFSELGMIAKLYHTHDLEALAKMVALFYQEQPADFSYLQFNPQMLQFRRIIRKPTLFQHMGITSSQWGYVQSLKDRFFVGNVHKEIGDNPTAIVLTNLKFLPEHSPEHVYNTRYGYFWSKSKPKKDDYFRIVFNKPQAIERIVVNSGLDIFPADKVYNAVLEISSKNNNRNDCIDYNIIGKFVNGKVDVQNVPFPLNTTKIRCIQIRFQNSQNFWAIIQEISIFLRR
ncbi:alpha-1,6-mannosyl-glycoprotein 4-beta-N-acetylglucosaminyltransferase-like isoform X2 [Mytilus californianus]|uniref:alpha-1,6-mannosyl-glycoprotein 4-beta-N-acetylglucosaminyltransferase-like isoform X2 n=1 Tax=Mytilus californianus TaxID=6549 RepID=UPI0022454BB0|nr:alpha-1,6-mannosyl-glycoprotein 4-beta-N-acetylglucosaminyltransferase-like isoform X2 [Mytilus californianus]